MTQLEELTRGATVRGILPNHNVTVIDAKWHGTDVVELTYKDTNGQPHTEILFRDREPTLEVVTEGRPWSFDGDGGLLRLVSEAHRMFVGSSIRSLAGRPHLFSRTPSPSNYCRLQRNADSSATSVPSRVLTLGREKPSWRVSLFENW